VGSGVAGIRGSCPTILPTLAGLTEVFARAYNAQGVVADGSRELLLFACARDKLAGLPQQ